MVTSNSHCDCCGYPTQSQVEDDCPHCGYPIDPTKEEQFLKASLRDLQRVVMHGGPRITITQLIEKYQQRLLYLYRLRSTPNPVLPAALSGEKVNPAEFAERAAHEQASPEISTNIRTQPLFTPHTPPVPTAPSQLAAASMPSSGVLVPILPLQPTSGRIFSLRSFLADQTINIIASLGAFLILLGSLSFIITT
ncbi:MAG TPA: hypothetical protein VN207_02020, partial [Ktedonobacteraceae bacterium]|nr:hypothetical protein [Ktedonobacteraceae bacterium]